MSWDADERTETDQDILDFKKAERARFIKDARELSATPRAESGESQNKDRVAAVKRQ